MKYILLPIAMVIGSCCWGQKIDSVRNSWLFDLPDVHSTPDRYFTLGNVLHFDSLGRLIPRYDTVKALLLVCDTASYLDYSINGNKKFFPKDFNITWQFGYEVRRVETRNNYDGMIDPGFTFGFKPQEWNIYFHEVYLDQNKKPLPKSIVVFLTKEIK